MRTAILLSGFLLLTVAAQSQFSVRLVVTEIATRQNDDIYIAGNFNNWNPRDENYKLKPFGGSRKSIVLKNMASGTYAFKFTRGAQDKIETTADGRDIPDRIIEVNGDISNEYSIAGWKDNYPVVPKKYTASPQVHILDTAFHIPQLHRTRRIWIYLPKNYVISSARYPVLYMQDGQNLFNEQTAAFGEWGVDECLDTLQQKTGKPCIIVGIDNDPVHRLTEYNPYDHAVYGKAEGKEYADFLAHTLKPFIDSKYRTLKGPENTSIAGSSMGGLISLYTVLQYPDIFGSAGIFSPSFSMAPAIYTEAEKFTTSSQPRFYLYAGSRESTEMVPGMEKMADILKRKQRYVIRQVINPLGQHNETYWKQEFEQFYRWLRP